MATQIEATVAKHDANKIIEEQLDQRLLVIGGCLDADVLAYVGPITYGADQYIKLTLEAIKDKRDVLAVILETGGGYIEIAERMARLFHHHYKRVVFIVPNYAMSAGTILVMCGHDIYMDYSSILGPIDPQVQKEGSSKFVPALGYLEQYARLIAKSEQGELTTAELFYLVQTFDPAEMYRYEQERELSMELLKDWLQQYKFEDWTRTEERNLVVTKGMKAQRAAQVAKLLNDTKRWHVHARGIPMEGVRRDLKLKVRDLDDPQECGGLGPAVREYYRLLQDFMLRLSSIVVLHTHGNYQAL